MICLCVKSVHRGHICTYLLTPLSAVKHLILRCPSVWLCVCVCVLMCPLLLCFLLLCVFVCVLKSAVFKNYQPFLTLSATHSCVCLWWGDFFKCLASGSIISWSVMSAKVFSLQHLCVQKDKKDVLGIFWKTLISHTTHNNSNWPWLAHMWVSILQNNCCFF